MREGGEPKPGFDQQEVKMSRKKNRNENRKTMSLPEAGKIYYGLSRNGSYEAARRGDIPTISVGRLKRVSVAVMERIVGQG